MGLKTTQNTETSFFMVISIAVYMEHSHFLVVKSWGWEEVLDP